VFKRNKPGQSSPDSPDALSGPDGTLPHSEQTGAPVRPGDSGLGVPPFRPALLKEAPAMSRAPFPAPQPAAPQSPPAPLPGSPAPRPMGAPGARPLAREPAERRTLVVGRGISLQGVVQDAERLVVEGTIEATMIHATELAISQGGVFRGEVEVEDAEVAGTIDGTLTVRNSLIVRATGKVLGTARCRRLQVEDGGQITGRIEMITDSAPRPAEPRVEAPAS
jgi:cytoskeletal protein CcmA (bactofilin family)